MKKFKIGVVGCGSIAKFRHLPEFDANPNAEIYAVCDKSLERAEIYGKQYNAKVCKDYKEMVQIPEIDAIAVCTPNAFHCDITVAALEAGKHVLCEKPLSISVEQNKKMNDAAAKSGKVLMVGQNQRLVGAHKKAKEIIAAGTLGKVLTFSTVFVHTGPDDWSAEGADTWFFKKDEAGIGSAADLGVHKADLFRFVLGDEVDEVAAFVTTLNKKYPGTDKLVSVDDNAVALLKMKSGAIGTITTSWTHTVEKNHSTIYCQDGMIEIFVDPAYDLTVTYKNGFKERYNFEGIATNEKQIPSGIPDEFINTLLEGKDKAAISGEEGAKSLQVMLACVESSETGKFVKVDSLG